MTGLYSKISKADYQKGKPLTHCNGKVWEEHPELISTDFPGKLGCPVCKKMPDSENWFMIDHMATHSSKVLADTVFDVLWGYNLPRRYDDGRHEWYELTDIRPPEREYQGGGIHIKFRDD